MARHQEAAFEDFVRTSSTRLLRTAYLLSGDRGHAEDIVQTALLRTARRWRQARASPEAYTYRVVVNLAKDRWRNLSRRPAETAFERDVALDPADSLVDHEELLSATRALAPGQRAVVVLRFFNDLSVEETAAILGCTPGSVKSQTSRALERLRATLRNKEQIHADR